MTDGGRAEFGIAAMEAGDGEWLALLHGACFPDDPWPADAWVTLLGQPGVGGIVALAAGEPVGFALWRWVADEAEILTIGVIPQRRGVGCGRCLVDHVLRRLPPAVATVFLEVAADNPAARALYAGRGFHPVGVRPGYYRRPGGAADALMLRLVRAYGCAEAPESQRLVGHHGRETGKWV